MENTGTASLTPPLAPEPPRAALDRFEALAAQLLKMVRKSPEEVARSPRGFLVGVMVCATQVFEEALQQARADDVTVREGIRLWVAPLGRLRPDRELWKVLLLQVALGDLEPLQFERGHDLPEEAWVVVPLDIARDITGALYIASAGEGGGGWGKHLSAMQDAIRELVSPKASRRPWQAVLSIPQVVLRDIGPSNRVLWEKHLHALWRRFGLTLVRRGVVRFHKEVSEVIARHGQLRRGSGPLIEAIRSRLRRSRGPGERALWESLLQDLQPSLRPEGESDVVIARCRFCSQPFGPPRRSNARSDVCRDRACRRALDAERHRTQYQADARYRQQVIRRVRARRRALRKRTSRGPDQRR